MISSLKTNCKIKTYIQRLNCVRIGQCLLLGQCCAACSSAKTNERSKESRKRKSDGEIHIFHNERYFSEDDWKKKSEIINKKLKASKTREARLAEKFQDQLIDLESDDHNDLAWIMDNENNNIPEDMKTLWHQQIEITQTASKNGYRWHPKIIKLCLELYCKNPHVLEPLRNVMHLPSNRSIRYYKNKCEQQSGWNKNIVEWCLKDARERNLRECDYWGGFVIDEMKIEENLEMVIKNGKHRLVGFVDLGNLHDDMQRLCGKTETSLASHVLQFVFLSDNGFRFPIAQFPSHDCTPSDLFAIFWEGVGMMKEAGFVIYWCILDGADVNRRFIQMHFPNYDPLAKQFVASNVHTGGPMVFIMDCKHNIKKIRNNLQKSNIEKKPRCLTVGGKKILWAQLASAYNFDQVSTSLHIHERLTEHHFNLDAASKMRNHLAEEVMNKSMLYLMQAHKRFLDDTGKDGSSIDETIKLLSHTSELIDFFCTSKQALHSMYDSRIRKLDSFLSYFLRWRAESKNQPKNFISSKLWFDLQSMVHGFKSIVKIKLTRFPESAIKPWIINQDVVENHFCQVRACNGQNNNPTYRLQESTQNSIRLGQNTISRKSNAGLR